MRLKRIYQYDEVLKNTYEGVEQDGESYWRSEYFKNKYGVKWNDLEKAFKNGLPFILNRNQYYISEQDFNDYYAGKIGNDLSKV